MPFTFCCIDTTVKKVAACCTVFLQEENKIKRIIWSIHRLFLEDGGLIFIVENSLMHRCGWCRRLSCTLRQKRICGKAAFSHRTHNWLIYWVLCISVRLCERVCAWGGLMHYAWLWSVMSGCDSLLLIMDNWYNVRICARAHTHTTTHYDHYFGVCMPYLKQHFILIGW